MTSFLLFRFFVFCCCFFLSILDVWKKKGRKKLKKNNKTLFSRAFKTLDKIYLLSGPSLPSHLSPFPLTLSLKAQRKSPTPDWRLFGSFPTCFFGLLRPYYGCDKINNPGIFEIFSRKSWNLPFFWDSVDTLAFVKKCKFARRLRRLGLWFVCIQTTAEGPSTLIFLSFFPSKSVLYHSGASCGARGPAPTWGPG